MIDWARVYELRDEIGIDDFDEIVQMFISEVNECLATLTDTMSAADLESALHFLKGSALNLGFREFADLCQQGETAAATGRTTPISITDIKALFAKSADEFWDQLKGKAA